MSIKPYGTKVDTESELQIKKYEELYNLTKEGLVEELKRFQQLDEKASRFLAVLSILLVVSGFVGKFALDSVVPPINLLDWLCLVSALAFILSVLIALGFVFSVLMIRDLSKTPMTEELMKHFDDNDYLTGIYSMTKGNVKAVAKNRNASDRKVEGLTRSYWVIIVSIIFAVIFVFAIVAQKWISPTYTQSIAERSSNYAREG